MKEGVLIYEGYLLTIHKIIEYCEDIETIINKYETNYEEYCSDISFQYSCNSVLYN